MSEKFHLSRRHLLVGGLTTLGAAFTADHLDLPHSEINQIDHLLLEAGMNPDNPINLHFTSGTHHRLPSDPENAYITGEVPCPGRSPDIHELISDYLNSPPPRRPPNEMARLPESPLNFSPPNSNSSDRQSNTLGTIGIGGNLSPRIQQQIEDSYQLNSPITIATDSFGLYRFSDTQIDASFNFATSQLLLAHLLISRNIIKHPIEALVPKTNSDSPLHPKNISRRTFLEIGMGATTFAAAYATNHLLLNLPYDRFHTNAHLGHAVHTLISTLPAHIAGRIDPETAELFLSTLDLRNRNIATNLFPAAIAASFSPIDTRNQDMLVRAGLLHMGLEYDFRRGVTGVKEHLKSSLAKTINFYLDQIESHQHQPEKRTQNLADFLFITRSLSTPVSDQYLELPPGARLPDSGLTTLWQTFIELSHQLKQAENFPRLDLLTHLAQLTANLNAYTAKSLANFPQTDSRQRGPLAYTNLHEFHPNAPFISIVSRPPFDSQIVVCLQNGTPFFFKLQASDSDDSQWNLRTDLFRPPATRFVATDNTWVSSNPNAQSVFLHPNI